MSERSLSIKIRRARKELEKMQSTVSIIYSYLASMNNISRYQLSSEKSPYYKMYVDLVTINLDHYSVKHISDLEKIIRKQKTKIKEYDKRICKLQLTQSMK